MPRFLPPALGWHRDLPDPRDLTPASEAVRALLKHARRPPRGGRPGRADLREFCPPIDEQQPLQSCTAHAGVGLVEYLERRAAGRQLEASPLFLYKMTRRLLDWSGDRGGTLRCTFKAMVRFGIPPECYWRREPARFDSEPKPFLYSFAREYRALSYVRLDPPHAAGDDVLQAVKAFLSAGFAVSFGFSVLSSLSNDPEIPAPTVFDTVRGGQAVLAIGFDDQRKIRSTRGALLIRNSWGQGWGEGGYGWLPYAYVLEGLAADFWTLLKPDWMKSGEFEVPTL